METIINLCGEEGDEDGEAKSMLREAIEASAPRFDAHSLYRLPQRKWIAERATCPLGM